MEKNQWEFQENVAFVLEGATQGIEKWCLF